MQKDFRREVVNGLISEQLIPGKKRNNRNSPLTIKKHKPTVSSQIRLQSSAHQPLRGTRRRCAKCSTRSSQVRTEWMCSVCNVPLCLSKNSNMLSGLPLKGNICHLLPSNPLNKNFFTATVVLKVAPPSRRSRATRKCCSLYFYNKYIDNFVINIFFN